MKKIQKWVYYCDFCGKRRLSGGAISLHEKHCTANPNRECRLCGRTESLVEIIKKWLAVREEWMKHETHNECTCWIPDNIREEMVKVVNVDAVREDLDEYCPACILAIIRQAKLALHPISIEFDFKKALAEWWAEKNDAEREASEFNSY